MDSPSDSDPSGSGYPAQGRRFSFQEAGEQPCQDCSAACCVYVPLRDFMVVEFTDLDYARYLLNFDRIELILYSSGLWRVHYVQPCRHLDPETQLCGVHGTPLQPQTCKTFSAWQCSYKRIYDGPEDGAAIRMDRRRLEHFASQVVFDGYRRIVEAPDFSTLRDTLPPLEETHWPPPPGSRVLEQWMTEVRDETPESEVAEYAFQERPDPCSGCHAWCCTRINFPQSQPNNEANLEHLRFLAGFPGIELGLGPGGWTAVVRSTCRHRLPEPSAGGWCGVHGQSAQPIACQSYQASTCAYKARFGQPRPAWYLRIESESLDAVLSLYRLDSQGYIRAHPEFEQAREAIEQDWVRRST